MFQASEEELQDALNIALEAGYRHIDTAPVYENEKVIGHVLKEWFDSGRIKRSDIFIVTKVISAIYSKSYLLKNIYCNIIIYLYYNYLLIFIVI